VRIPKYCLHKATGQGYARLRGRCVYFGPHGAEESRKRYEAAIAELLTTPEGTAPAKAPSPASVREGVEGYLIEMKGEWGDGERGIRHLVRLRHALDVVVAKFGPMPLARFGVAQLEAVRREMVRRDWSRKHVNENVNVVRRCWKWLTLRGHVPAGVLERIQALEHLKAGRSPARESQRHEPPDADVLARVLMRLDRTNPVVAAMVRVQLASGARTGELVAMSTDRIDTTGPVWIYRPLQHKNLHRGKGRAVVLPPEAVAAIRGVVLARDGDGRLIASADAIFDPRRAVELRPRLTAHAVGWRARGGNSRPAGSRYSSVTYAQAVARACKAEGVPPFRPYSLRHACITRWAETLGVERARVLAGHATARMTSHYVHTDAASLAALLVPPPKAG